MHKSDLEAVASDAFKIKTDSNYYAYDLPAKYRSLSMLDRVDVVSNDGNKTAFFSIFRGVPDGSLGFLKVHYRNNKKNNDPTLFEGWDRVEPLSDNWFLVSN